jgi:hypothetical protein
VAQQFYDIEVLDDHPEIPRSDVDKRIRLYALDPNGDGSYYSIWIQDGSNKYPLLLSTPATGGGSAKPTSPASGSPAVGYIPVVGPDGYGASGVDETPTKLYELGSVPSALTMPQGQDPLSGDVMYVASTTSTVDEDGDPVERANLALGTPPGFTRRVATSTVGISANATTQIYAVPLGSTFIPTMFVLRAASGAFTTQRISFGFDAGATDVVGADAYEELTGNDKFTIATPMTGAEIGAAGAQLSVTVSGAAGSSLTVEVDVFGYTI